MSNNIFKGFIIGLIAPIAGFIVYVAFFTEESDPIGMFRKIVNLGKLAHVISLSILINLLIFFMKIKTYRDDHAKGVLFATMLYGVIIFIIKFS